MRRCCILIVGMHRSGTSALTRTLGLLGAALPRETMPAVADNPRGYWEPPAIARFNNRLLESAGTRWNDDAAIPAAWFTAPARHRDLDEAARLLDEAYPGQGTFVCKDPRLCRLLPFWLRVLATAGIAAHPVLMLRDPVEVSRSLAARAENPAFRPAAIVSPARAVLLWLRYVLDAERHSRGRGRQVVCYDRLLADWRNELQPLVAAGLIPRPDRTAAAAVDGFLDRSLQRNRIDPLDAARSAAADPGVVVSQRLIAVLRGQRDRAAVPEATRHELDRLATTLDRLVANYAPLRRELDPRHADDPWAERALALLDRVALAASRSPAAPTAVPTRPSVLFLSGVPDSVGHVYRVEHAVAALEASGWRASWLPFTDAGSEAAAGLAEVVVVFRAGWNARLDRIAAGCRQRGGRLIYDVDDLIFDPAVIAAGSVAALALLTPEEREEWVLAAASQRTLLERADAAVLTTHPLAAAAGRHCPRCFVLPNSLDPAMEEAAAAATATIKDSAADGRPRLCFASGTPSHDRDFTVAAEAIARLFARRPEPRLVVIGHLDTRLYPCLLPFVDRIEWRPPVPLLELFGQVARCDINLAPLEIGNPFCEAKSAVRCLVAAAVGLPTVASPTQPLREAIVPGRTGLLAGDAAEWDTALERLVTEPGLADRLGGAARVDAIARFGFAASRELTEAVFAEALTVLPDAPLPASLQETRP